MEFRFETELGGKNAVFELRTAPLTDEDAAKKTTLRGYPRKRAGSLSGAD